MRSNDRFEIIGQLSLHPCRRHSRLRQDEVSDGMTIRVRKTPADGQSK